jgi:hypothetical protein
VLGAKSLGPGRRVRMEAIAKMKGIARSDYFCVTVGRDYC